MIFRFRSIKVSWKIKLNWFVTLRRKTVISSTLIPSWLLKIMISRYAFRGLNQTSPSGLSNLCTSVKWPTSTKRPIKNLWPRTASTLKENTMSRRRSWCSPSSIDFWECRHFISTKREAPYAWISLTWTRNSTSFSSYSISMCMAATRSSSKGGPFPGCRRLPHVLSRKRRPESPLAPKRKESSMTSFFIEKT